MKTVRLISLAIAIVLLAASSGCGSPATPAIPTPTETLHPTATPTLVPFDITQAGQTIINDGFPLLTTSETRPEVCPGNTCSVYNAGNNYITVLGNGTIIFLQKDYGGGAFIYSTIFKDLYGQQVADLVDQNLPTSLGGSYTLTLNGFFVSLEVPNSTLSAIVIPGGSEESYNATQTAWAPKP